jgi:hypothetical protein
MRKQLAGAFAGFQFLRCAWRAWCNASEHGTGYAAIVSDLGIPTVCVLVGKDREAWRISTLAIEANRGTNKN